MHFRKALVRSCAAGLLAAAVALPSHAQNAFQRGLDAYLSGEYDEALALWQPVAESGNAVAAFNIGVLYARGLGVQADPVQALRWYRQSALAGYANAQFNLGSAHYDGDGTARNIGQAVAWWEKAAEQNHPEALYNLATLYRDGRVVEQNLERARGLFERGAAVGDPRAESALAKLQDRVDAAGGEGELSEPPPAGDEWPSGENPEHYAVQLFAVAKQEAARRFVLDNGLAARVHVYQAEVDGKTWFKGVSGSYADHGAAQAARKELQDMLPGVSPWIRRYRDIQAEAVADVPLPAAVAPPVALEETAPAISERTGASTGDASAASGDETTETSAASAAVAATESRSQSAEPVSSRTVDDDPESSGAGEPAATETAAVDEAAARLNRGQRAFNAQDYDEAFAAWRPLAEEGVADAQYGIGFMYESGWGVDRDYSEAYRWYQLAAQQGHVKSQFNLGMLYRNGNGVAQNDALGLYWIQTAADRGDERALSYLKKLNQ